MKEELKSPEVKNVSVAVAFETKNGATIYNVYLINERTEMLENVLITAHGYGIDEQTKEQVKTSTLRHSLGNVEPRSMVKIEPIMGAVFKLNNAYRLSFWLGNKIYDKQYIFSANSILKENCIKLPIIGLQGVIVK